MIKSFSYLMIQVPCIRAIKFGHGERRITQSVVCWCDKRAADASYNFTENVEQDREAEQHRRQRLKEEDEEFSYQTRQHILHASLPHVPQLGWTKKALTAGAEASGQPSVAHGLFPRGGIELVEYFYQTSNQKLADQLAQEVADLKEAQAKLKIGKFVRGAVETRLRMLTPYLDTWPQAMGLMALPLNAPTALSNLGRLADNIWYYAGDKSVDMNWYSKRVTLAAVYKTTELYMLQDKSEDFMDTWKFLDRRMEDLATYGIFVRQVQEFSDTAGDVMWSSFHLVRNVLGLNTRWR